MAMRLKLWRFIAKGALDALPQLKFRAREGSFEIREAFPSQVFKFRDKGL
jgi:hypothetical protein